MTALVFMDVETTGLDVDHDDVVWEFAAIRREEDGTETEWHTFVDHPEHLASRLPEPFQSDYRARYDPIGGLSVVGFRRWLEPIFAGRPHVVGANPDFDTTAVRKYLNATRSRAPWHYHLIDVEALALGYLNGIAGHGHSEVTCGPICGQGGYSNPPSAPWKSEDLSRALNVDPAQFARHTAMGDTLWVKAIYDRIMGGAQ